MIPSTVTSNSTGTTKTLTTEAFDPFGPIYYYSTTTGVAVDAAPGVSYLWLQHTSFDLRYAFNAGSNLVANKPIYIRVTPQSDGTVMLDGNDCIVQALPSSEDGKAYIWFGYAVSASAAQLRIEHPIYCYRDGAIREWSGEIDRLWAAVNAIK